MTALASSYLILGKDRTAISAQVAELCGDLDESAVTTHNATTTTAADALADTFMLGLFATTRVVIVYGADLWDTNDVSDVLAWLKDPPQDVTIVLVAEALRKGARLLKAFTDSNTFICDGPSTPAQLVTWVQQRFVEAGVTVSKPAAAALIGAVGDDSLDRIVSDVERLATWSNGEIELTPEIMQAHATEHTASEKVFALTDAWATRDRTRFLRMAEQLLEQGESPHALTPILGRHLRLVSYTVRALANGSRRDAQQCLEAAGIKWPKMVDQYIQQASKLSQPRIDAALARTTLLEAELKGATVMTTGKVASGRKMESIIFERALFEMV